MSLSLIIAMDKNKLIGNGNKLPWHLPADLKHFQNITTNNIIVMGRSTFESINKALPNRTNVVLTSDKNFQADDVIVLHSIEELEEFVAKQKKEVFIIGGSVVIKQLYDKIDNFYITHIQEEFKGDCFVKFINFNELTLIEKEEFYPDSENNYFYSFCKYKKNNNFI